MTTKMTFGEWCGTVSIVVAAVVAMFFLMLPISLLIAWTRVQMWDWFVVPYFHLPHLSVWLMYGLGILISSIVYNPFPELKDDLYKASAWARIAGPLAVQVLGFLVAYLIHIWVLRG